LINVLLFFKVILFVNQDNYVKHVNKILKLDLKNLIYILIQHVEHILHLYLIQAAVSPIIGRQ